jgi:hypothetical protein
LEALLAALAGTELAQWMRFSRWGYAIANTVHVFGIALLVGAILPLNLRLLGFWPTIAIEPLLRILPPVAAAGLIVAAASGSLLFLAGPADYAGLWLFLIKVCLIVVGTLHALAFQLVYGKHASPVRLKLAGGFSLIIWLSVLILGRFIAFV